MRRSRSRPALCLALVLGYLAGCSSAPPVPPGVTDINGVWQGRWNGGTIGAGGITLTLKQVGTRVTGDVAISGVTAISATEGPIDGWITGDTFSFQQKAGVLEGEMTVNGDQMDGATTGRLKVALTLRRQPLQ